MARMSTGSASEYAAQSGVSWPTVRLAGDQADEQGQQAQKTEKEDRSYAEGFAMLLLVRRGSLGQSIAGAMATAMAW
jgi:hypothetical protein